MQYCATGAVTALQIVIAVARQKLRREIWWCSCCLFVREKEIFMLHYRLRQMALAD
jgi:hypothetical protein